MVIALSMYVGSTILGRSLSSEHSDTYHHTQGCMISDQVDTLSDPRLVNTVTNMHAQHVLGFVKLHMNMHKKISCTYILPNIREDYRFVFFTITDEQEELHFKTAGGPMSISVVKQNMTRPPCQGQLTLGCCRPCLGPRTAFT